MEINTAILQRIPRPMYPEKNRQCTFTYLFISKKYKHYVEVGITDKIQIEL